MPSTRKSPSKITKANGHTSTLATTGDNVKHTPSFVSMIERTHTSMRVSSTSSPTNSGYTWEMMASIRDSWESCRTGTCLLEMAHSP